MTIQKNRDGNKLEIKLEGKLTAITAPDLEKELADAEKDVDEVVIDMENLDHVASAGLRTLLTLQKRMRKKNGRMIICKVKPEIRDIFEVTGLTDLLKIEE